MSDEHKTTDGQQVPSNLDDEMREIMESFFVEASETMEQLGKDLLELEKSPTDPELLNRIFRGVHTVKGTSSFLGVKQMPEFAHKLEDLLNKLRKGELVATPSIIDIVLEAFDTLKILLERLKKKGERPLDLSLISQKLLSVTHVAVTPDSAKQDNESTASPATNDGQRSSTGSVAKSAEATIRVDVARLDDLMNLVGELVLGRNRLSQASHSLMEEHEQVPGAREIYDASMQIDFITTELQAAVMKTRMVPIAKVFNRLPRLVRDLEKETGKEINLQLYGEETELDKSLIEELNDPLVHIIRNAVDHGIEFAEERARVGKPRAGALVVSAEHQGNQIVISVEDDGRGMDHEQLKQKAVEKRIITEVAAHEMSKREAFNLIFEPGFSTAQLITSLSGRGVGMDVVRTNITKLKGTVEIESTVERGTLFVVKLPLTLAIIQALLVKVGSEIFAVPLASVQEVVRIRPNEIATVNGREVIRMRDSVLPLVRMTDVFGLPAGNDGIGCHYIVVVGWADQHVGIVVDSFLGQREVVIKTLGDFLGDIAGIAGSSILGDGRTILIIDVGQLVELCTRREYLTVNKGAGPVE